jgi:hypothetical protein
MAIWQFSMHLIPRDELAQVWPAMSGELPSDLFDAIEWWSTRQPPVDLAQRLLDVLPEVRSWRPESRQWGASDATTVVVHYTGPRVDEIWARLDLRQPWRIHLETLVQLAIDANGCWIGGEESERVLIGQDTAAVMAAVRDSEAARFVVAPREYPGRKRTEQPGEP